MVNTPVVPAVAPKVPDVAAPTAATPRVVPTPSQPVRVNWGAWLEQGLIHETKMIESAVNVGVNLVEGATPFGWAIKMFAGQEVVDGLVDQGLKVLEGILDTQAVTVDATQHPVYAYVLNMINNSYPNVATALGPKLDDLIKTALAKVGISV